MRRSCQAAVGDGECNEHLEIIDAILANDMPAAAERMHQHLSHAYHTTGAANAVAKGGKAA